MEEVCLLELTARQSYSFVACTLGERATVIVFYVVVSNLVGRGS